MKKANTKKIEIISLIIVILQIFLLMNLVSSNSYLIHQADKSLENLNTIDEEKSFNNLINSGLNLLSGILSIKQIGIVSAEVSEVPQYCCSKSNGEDVCSDTSDPFSPCDVPILSGTCEQNNCMKCCPETNEGEFCKDVSMLFEDCARPLIDGNCLDIDCISCCPKTIEEEFCKDVSKFHQDICSDEYPLYSTNCQAINCRKVVLNDPNIPPQDPLDLDISWNCCSELEDGSICQDIASITPELCSVSPLPTKCEDTVNCKLGCCIDEEEGLCATKASKQKCEEGGGEWDNDFNCLIQECQKGCCVLGNNAEFVTETRCDKLSISWGFEKDFKEYLKTEIQCLALVANTSTESCIGNNCVTPEKKDCIDEKGDVKKDGESWCSYEGYIGDGKDTVGSRHWKQSCVDGEIVNEGCQDYRGYICAQTIMEEGSLKFSMASCVPNEAILCLGYNSDQATMGENCNENKHCMIKNIYVDSYFKFDVCVGRYPPGIKDYCSMASQTCTVIYVKDWKGSWKCEKNCNCERQVFPEQMNNLCISMGDCGSYINYIGNGTDNIKVTNAPMISWKNYKNYVNLVAGQFVEPQDIDKFLSSLTGTSTTLPGEEPDGFNKGVKFLGQIIGAAGSLVSASMFLGSMVPSMSIVVSPGVYAGLSAFSGAAAGAAIGAMAGAYLAKALGISGIAATVMMVAGAVAGAVIGAWAVGMAIPVVGWVIAIIAVLIMIYIALIGWGKTKEIKVKFECMPWEAPVGGSDCERCHEDDSKPCTKYKCESLGQTCKLLNENEENPICESIAHESNPPVISAGDIFNYTHLLNNPLNPFKIDFNYKFQKEKTKYVELKQSNGKCIQEFTPILFNLNTDEFAQCKYSFQKTSLFEEMEEYPLEQTKFGINHTFKFKMPSLSHLEVYNISEDLKESFGNLNMYVRCQDYQGNFNINEYIVNFCINSEPDTTAVNHEFTITNPKNKYFLKYGTTQQDMKMRINEPAECKYDIIPGIDYDAMINSMTCNWMSEEEDNWLCNTTLSVSGGENKFYIKCRDKPWFDYLETDEEREKYKGRNTNVNDFIYTLHVTDKELIIDSITPKGTLEFGFEPVSVDLEVKTSGGVDNGNSKCSYQWAGNWIQFLSTFSNSHTQPGVNLMSGNFNTPIKCEDDVENVVYGNAVFKIEVDSEPPIAVRVFYEGGDLKLITDEEAKCYYDFNSCDFNLINGSSMSSSLSIEHSAKWSVGQTHYIKCEDFWGNTNPTCAIKVEPSN